MLISSVAMLVVEYLFKLHDDIIIHVTRQREVTLVTQSMRRKDSSLSKGLRVAQATVTECWP